ncbi:MAG: amidohydrolase family protein [Halobacteriota archaeon]
MTIDTHTHAWAEPTYDHPWVNELHATIVQEFSVGITYPAGQLRGDIDDIDVDEAVVVGYPIYDWTDNGYLVDVVREHDDLYGIVMLDVFDDEAPEKLREYMAVDGILGFRLGVQFPRDHRDMWGSFDPEAEWLPAAVAERDEVWTIAAETDALVQLFVHHGQLDQVQKLIETYPDLRILVDHWAHADPADPVGEESFARLGNVLEHDQTYVKVSETPFVSDEAYPYADVHDHLRWLLETAGRERVIWGSDFPNVSHPDYGDAEYAEALSWIEHVDGLSSGDMTWLTERAFRNCTPHL